MAQTLLIGILVILFMIKKHHLLAFFGAFAVLVADQVTKYFVVAKLSFCLPYDLSSFCNLVLVYNKGVSFGFFQNNHVFGKFSLILVALVLISWLVWALLKSQNPLEAFSYGLIIGGAFGNVLDRFIYGAVVDFLDFHLFHYHWPAFNMADSAIVLGVGIVLLQQFIDFKKKKG